MPTFNPVKVRGTVVAIGTTAADPALDTYIAIDDCQVAGLSVGPAWQSVDGTVLTDTYKQEFKTIADGGAMELTGNSHHSNLGEAALLVASLDNDDVDLYNFRITMSNSRKIQFKGRVMTFNVMLGGVGTLKMFKASVQIMGAYTEAA